MTKISLLVATISLLITAAEARSIDPVKTDYQASKDAADESDAESTNGSNFATENHPINPLKTDYQASKNDAKEAASASIAENPSVKNFNPKSSNQNKIKTASQTKVKKVQSEMKHSESQIMKSQAKIDQGSQAKAQATSNIQEVTESMNSEISKTTQTMSGNKTLSSNNLQQ